MPNKDKPLETVTGRLERKSGPNIQNIPGSPADLLDKLFERAPRPEKMCLAYCGEACDCGIREAMERDNNLSNGFDDDGNPLF